MPYTLKTRRIKTKNPTTGLYEEFDASASPVVDSSLSGVSENPVQNKVVKNALDQKADISNLNGKVSKTDAVIENSVSMGRVANTAVGALSVALGSDVAASGAYSAAIGASCSATQIGAVALCVNNTASGYYSFAEGMGNTASGVFTHAEGNANTANGFNSHAEGAGNTSYGAYSHVQGKYAVTDNSTGNPSALGQFCHIVGNGTADNDRSNAHTLDWNGNAEYAGDVKANACGGQNPISLVNVAAALNKEIAVQSSQPSSSENKLWINPTGSGEIVVPTQAEMEAALNGKASVIGTPSDGQFLVYSSSASAYVPTTVPAASGVSF